MQETQDRARAAILAGGARARDAALAWDKAVADLALAWRQLTAACDTLRVNRTEAHITAEYGPMELRLVHFRATYELARRMIEAGYPWSGSFMHNDDIKGGLAEFVGKHPEQHYMPELQPAIQLAPAKPARKSKKLATQSAVTV